MSEHIPKKSLGQHWLHDTATLDAIVAAANIVPHDTVIEIGPGLGTLTEKLLATNATVIAIEFDESLLGGLRAKYANRPNFQLVHEDILKYDFSLLPKNYKIVANIPYYLTSQLLRILSDEQNKPICAELLMQKEVTERVCASPPDMSILSVAMQLEFATTTGVFVPAHMFTPPPKVDSLVLHLERRTSSFIAEAQKTAFMRLVKAGFSAKRKTLRNTLSAGLHLEKPVAEKLLTDASIDYSRRAETLSLDEWKTLYDQAVDMLTLN